MNKLFLNPEHKGIEKSLAGQLEGDAMLAKVCLRFSIIPFKADALISVDDFDWNYT